MARRDVLALAALGAAAAVVSLATPAAGYPDYYAAWQARYPTSTIPMRMESIFGAGCFTCHTDPFGDVGTCYREDIRALLHQGVEIDQALATIENVDSDGDGVTNIQEILAPRVDMPGQVGYHAGLVGIDGRGPCAPNPDVPSSMQRETPCRADWDFGGTVNSADISAFLSAWLASLTNGDLNADVNGDDTVNSSDISEFLTRWLNALSTGNC